MKQKERAASPLLLTGKKSRHVRHEIGDSHFSGEDEGDGAGEEPKRQEDAADEFEDAGRKRQAAQCASMGADGKVEELLRSVLDELQGCHDAQHPQSLGSILCEAFEKLHLKLHFTPRPAIDYRPATDHSLRTARHQQSVSENGCSSVHLFS